MTYKLVYLEVYTEGVYGYVESFVVFLSQFVPPYRQTDR